MEKFISFTVPGLYSIWTIDWKLMAAALIHPLSESVSEDEDCWKQEQEAVLCWRVFFFHTQASVYVGCWQCVR